MWVTRKNNRIKNLFIIPFVIFNFFLLQTILFTTDENILELISENDLSFEDCNYLKEIDTEADRPITGTVFIIFYFFF